MEAKKLYRKAILEWEKLISKYPNSEEARGARYKIAEIYERKLQDLKKALEAYKKVRHGSNYYTAQANIQRMTKKELFLSTKRIYRSNEVPKIQVKMRNIKKLSIRIYKLNMEEYFRKEHKMRGVESLDLSLIEPDKLWDVTVNGYIEYLPLSQEIPVKIDKVGVYAVHVSSETMEATTLVIQSDLDLILKSSKKESLVYVQNMVKNKSAREVNVLLSDGRKILFTGKTNKDGVFIQKSDKLKNISKLSVFVEKDGHIASNILALSGLGFSMGLSPKTYIYTNKSAYMPGEKVHIRAIARDVVDGVYVIPKNKNYEVNIYDSYGRFLANEKQKLSDFGTLHSAFQLPKKTVNGRYRIEIVRKDTKQKVSSYFKVAQFQLRHIQLSVSFLNRVYFRGEKITATFKANYYYGTPLAHKKLRYILPDGRTYTAKTDAYGLCKVTFDTTRSKPGTSLFFSATLDPEGVSVKKSIFLARYGFSIQLSKPRSTILSGEPTEFTIKTTDVVGKAVSKKIAIGIYRKVTLETNPILVSLPWNKLRRSTLTEIKVKEHNVETNKEGLARLSFSLEKGGNYIIRAKGQDRFQNHVTAVSSLYVSADEDKTRLRIFTKKQNLKVGENFQFKIHSRLKEGLALITFEGENIIAYRIVKLVPGYNPIGIDVDNRYFPNFHMSIAFMAGNKFYQVGQNFSVVRRMNIELRMEKDVYLPGEKAKVEVFVTDHMGKPIKAEVSLALVNEALFALHPDARTHITSFFQKDAKRHAKMRTITSCSFSYSGKTKKILQAILAEQKRVREEEKKKWQEDILIAVVKEEKCINSKNRSKVLSFESQENKEILINLMRWKMVLVMNQANLPSQKK